MSETKTLTDSEIVAGLRSEDPQERHAALEALMDGDGGCLMLHINAKQARSTFAGLVDVGQMFAQLVMHAEQCGRQLGLQLSWVNKPQDDQIVVPPGRLMV